MGTALFFADLNIMDIEYIEKNGSTVSVSVNGIKLHSTYSPEKEAQRFVDSLECSFSPAFVLITEPALSYTSAFLRERFPNSKLCCIRYTNFFSEYDSQWDKCFYYSPSDGIPLSQHIYNYMGEEGISSCLFISWAPSDKVFSEQSDFAWKQIKEAILKSRTVLATMTYFAKRWTKNAIRFCLFAKKTAYIQKGDSPVIVCASGPSLKSSIPYLIKNRPNFFLLAVSSSVKPLLENNIIPDLILSTDGGYWAKQHLSFAMKNNYDIPVALPLEAACYGDIFNQTIVPLSYGDGCGEALLNECKYTRTKAMRNGTVSGTAAKLAMDITRGNVFFCGLDLSPSKGFGHTQPNELEETNSLKDNRLTTKETRIVPGSFYSAPLNTYLDWFRSNDFGGRLFRLSDNFRFQNDLGKNLDVNWDFFEKNCHKKLSKPNFIFSEQKFDIAERKTFLKKVIENHITDKEWIKNILPSEYIVWERSKETENKIEAENKIQKKMQEFYGKLINFLDK